MKNLLLLLSVLSTCILTGCAKLSELQEASKRDTERLTQEWIGNTLLNHYEANNYKKGYFAAPDTMLYINDMDVIRTGYQFKMCHDVAWDLFEVANCYNGDMLNITISDVKFSNFEQKLFFGGTCTMSFTATYNSCAHSLGKENDKTYLPGVFLGHAFYLTEGACDRKTMNIHNGKAVDPVYTVLSETAKEILPAMDLNYLLHYPRYNNFKKENFTVTLKYKKRKWSGLFSRKNYESPSPISEIDNEETNFDALSRLMKSQGHEYHLNAFYDAKTAPIAEKLEKNLIYREKKWHTRASYINHLKELIRQLMDKAHNDLLLAHKDTPKSPYKLTINPSYIDGIFERHNIDKFIHQKNWNRTEALLDKSNAIAKESVKFILSKDYLGKLNTLDPVTDEIKETRKNEYGSIQNMTKKIVYDLCMLLMEEDMKIADYSNTRSYTPSKALLDEYRKSMMSRNAYDFYELPQGTNYKFHCETLEELDAIPWNERAEIRYPLYKEGENIPAFFYMSKTYSGTLKFEDEGKTLIKIGNKLLRKNSLTKEQLSMFLPQINTEMRQQFIESNKKMVRTKLDIYNREAIATMNDANSKLNLIMLYDLGYIYEESNKITNYERNQKKQLLERQYLSPRQLIHDYAKINLNQSDFENTKDESATSTDEVTP